MSTTTLAQTKVNYTPPTRRKDTYPIDPSPRIDTANKAENDFFWTYTEEPHRTRRQAIIKAHPEVGQSTEWFQ